MEHPTHALKNDLGQVKSLPNSTSYCESAWNNDPPITVIGIEN